MEGNELMPELILPIQDRDNCLGTHSARHTLVEYGDYTSSRCRDVVGAVNELVKELQDDFCFVFRNFPQKGGDPRSRPVAEAVEAAGLQGKFWLMHDRTFAHQGDLSDKVLREIARGLPIQMSDFERDLSSGDAARRVDEDVETGTEAGVVATPTFFVNGVLYTGAYEFLPMLRALQAGRTAPR